MRYPAQITDFEGEWLIERGIEDRRGRQAGHLAGRCTVTPTAEGFLYLETGRLTMGAGPALEASRRYIWRPVPGGIAVFFDDGRPFHHVALAQAVARDRHLCAPDVYDVRYDFARWPEWTAEWQVAGPRKDYVAITRYWRP